MVGSRNVLERAWFVACGALLLELVGCGGQQFTGKEGAAGATNTQAGGETGGLGGGSSAGGAGGAGGGAASAGEAASGGADDAGGMGGTGGAAPSGCDCPAGKYCRDGSVDCLACSDLSKLHFSTPERMSTLSDNGEGSRFPRVGLTTTDLVYRFEGVGLRYTTDASTSPGGSVKSTIPEDSGPLLLAEDVTGFGSLESFNFLFDRNVEGTRRSLHLGKWNKGLTQFELAPAPYNGSKSDYSAAVALHPTPDGIARIYWMTDRDVPAGMPGATLVTATLESDSNGAPLDLKIGQPECDATDADLSPWVTDDGKILLVSHTRLDASCQATGQGKDLYAAFVQPATGAPLPDTAAAVLNDVNSPMNDVEPSFSADLCSLYFASDRDGSFGLYRAQRR